MTNVHQYNPDTVHALVVVSAKEHGKLFQWRNGSLTPLSYTEEHPPQYSDNEGFFTHSGAQRNYGSGNVREEDDDRNLDRYISAITEELRTHIEHVQPEIVLVLEPEHLKGLVAKHLVTSSAVPVHTIAFGNYVEQPQAEVAEIVRSSLTEVYDPRDPASVAGEPNAAEKKHLLEVGQEEI